MSTAASQELEVRQTSRMGSFDERDDNLIRYLGLNPSSPTDRAAVAVCKHYGFDPILKHVVVIPKGGVYITRDGLLNVAHRSGQLDGIVVEQDPVLEGDEWVAKVSVYRKDMRHPFTFPGRYPVSGSNKQYAPEMALKAAEAHALRRAFDVTGLPTLDEQNPNGEPTQPVPTARVTAEDITAPRRPKVEPAAAAHAAETYQDAELADEPVTPQQLQKLGILRKNERYADDDEGRADWFRWVETNIGRQIGTNKDLTKAEASVLIDVLETADSAE